MNFLFVIGGTVVSFVAIQLYNRNNANSQSHKQNKPGSDIALFFFLLIIFTVLSYWLNTDGVGDFEGGAGAGGSVGGGMDADIERALINTIKQDVEVGLSPF